MRPEKANVWEVVFRPDIKKMSSDIRPRFLSGGSKPRPAAIRQSKPSPTPSDGRRDFFVSEWLGWSRRPLSGASLRPSAPPGLPPRQRHPAQLGLDHQPRHRPRRPLRDRFAQVWVCDLTEEAALEALHHAQPHQRHGDSPGHQPTLGPAFSTFTDTTSTSSAPTASTPHSNQRCQSSPR